MESIEDIAYEIYTKNIEYLSKEHKNIAKLITIFDMALQNGEYEPFYDLEYVNDSFDLKNLKTQNYLYHSQSKKISEDLTSSVNYKKNSRIFEGFPIYHLSEKQFDSLPEYAKNIKSMLPLMEYYATNFKDTDELKNIDKFIFIGVGLGLHIPLIDEKINAKEYLIIEDSLEIFKLSLFTTKYYELAQNATLFFSVADDENLFLNTVQTYLANTFYDNRYLKYCHLPMHSDQKIKLIQNSLMSQSFIFFPYRVELEKFLRPLEFINNGYKTLDMSKHIPTLLDGDKPVLILAAGPSFKENISWIKDNHTKFILIAVSAVLKTLHEHDITPDIITHIDGSNESNTHFEGLDIDSFLNDSIIILGSNVSPYLREKFNKENVYNFEEDTNYYKNRASLPASCVGSFSILLSLSLSAKRTYLLGVDLAVNQETGATHHSEDHVDFKNADIDNKDTLQDSMSFISNLFKVKGNFEDEVYTNSLLHASVQLLYKTMPRNISNEQVVYNMSGGVYIEKTSPLHIQALGVALYPTLEKEKLRSSIRGSLNEESIKELTSEDVRSLHQRLDHAKKIDNMIRAYVAKPTKTNADAYLYDLLGLVSDSLQKRTRETVNLIRINYDFFQFMIPIIMDIFNTKGLKNEKRHIKKVDKLLMDDLLDVSKIYIDTLEKFIKNRC